MFDEAVKTDVIKALSNSELEVNCTLDGKDIKVKLETSKKEYIETALKKLKKVTEDTKRDMKNIRHEINKICKKLELIVSKEQIKIIEKDFLKVL